MKNFILSIVVTLIFAAPGLTREKTSTATDFKRVTTTGKKMQLSDYRGKVVILDFWASWCGPCRKEFPFLVDLFQDVNKGHKENILEVVAVNLDDHAGDMKKFLSELKMKVPFDIVRDTKGQLPAAYQVEAMPTTVMIDKKGVVRFRHTGFKEKSKVKYLEEVAGLIKEK